mmetsp:Transcript_5129/g.6304  ORF Transcript_5129/g.6304 Transcript_5129/m.6304 type:complete len:165 (+) Transcript_5129:122-616(+)
MRCHTHPQKQQLKLLLERHSTMKATAPCETVGVSNQKGHVHHRNTTSRTTSGEGMGCFCRHTQLLYYLAHRVVERKGATPDDTLGPRLQGLRVKQGAHGSGGHPAFQTGPGLVLVGRGGGEHEMDTHTKELAGLPPGEGVQVHRHRYVALPPVREQEMHVDRPP